MLFSSVLPLVFQESIDESALNNLENSKQVLSTYRLKTIGDALHCDTLELLRSAYLVPFILTCVSISPLVCLLSIARPVRGDLPHLQCVHLCSDSTLQSSILFWESCLLKKGFL
jgi:hypothetical protein